MLLQNLPPSIEKLSERIGLRKVPDDYIKSFIKDTIPRSSITVDEYKQYIFSFDKYKKRRTAVRQKKRKTLLNANEQRKLAIFKVDPQTTKFSTFIPVHELWKKYMQGILQLKEILPDDLSNIYQKLLKADYHGCMLVVASSVCPNYVGARGIVVQETRNVFRLITEENKIKTIPKKGTVFCFELNGNIFKIYGENFRYVPYERSRLKYKTKAIVDP
ncbi:ribonuclease P protein subunit p29-like isoform X2 [Stegodyphus dumicola]|uniref:ribonuclease P protein subunit p29-like isoform X2 n=1 Tax=Stegodyphus dumicola TaxID=202533 RepID=UPI0015B1E996|nr:ribonuclease P protein subunit p29-like isoform X2 [Stegodyphus dumicola]